MSEIIWQTLMSSTAFLNSSKFSILPKRKCLLEYSYEDEEGASTIFEKLIFDGVESFKCTHYKACSLEMIKAYCKIVDVGESDWLIEIKQNLSQAKVKAENLKHLRIYFDDGPCYEFICKSFEVTSEKQKNHFENLDNLL